MTRVLQIKNTETIPDRKVRVTLKYKEPLFNGEDSAVLSELNSGESVNIAVFDGVSIVIDSIHE